MSLRLLLLFGLMFVAALLPQLSAVNLWDERAIAWLVSVRRNNIFQILAFLTHLGGTAIFLLGLGAISLFHALKRRYKTVLIYILAMGILRLGSFSLKIVITRPRPQLAWQQLSTFSMPSGHATNAVLVFGVLGIFFFQRLNNRIFRIFASGLCGVLIVLIGFSRLYLGVHFPSDVLMGFFYASAGLWCLHGLHRKCFEFY